MNTKNILPVLVLAAFGGMCLAACASTATPSGTAAAPESGKDQTMAAPTAQSAQVAFTAKVDADDSRIRYSGRIDFSDPKAPSFAFSGVQIVASFEGTGLDVIMSDSGKQNFFNVSIDGKEPLVIQSSGRGAKTITLARDLADGVHTVEIFKRTEASCGVASFKGFVLQDGKSLVAPPARPARRMEFVGDSITCGYGNMVSTTTPEKFHFTSKNENSALSWAGQTAKALDAEFMSTSYSGRGMFRNLDGNESGTLPKIYGTIFPDKPEQAAWDAKRYTPDVIVINLGTNDYGSTMTKTDLGQDQFDEAFAGTYREFIKTLRTLHGPKVKIVCAVGSMMSDYYPAGQRVWSRIQDTVGGLVDALNESGDKEVFFLALSPQTSPFGEDWHPTVATHTIMSEAAVELIREITGW